MQNTDGINNATPRIIPVNNSNGIPISNITFNSITKDVTVELGVNYSYGQIFPFNVGDKVLIENVFPIDVPVDIYISYLNKM